MLIKMLDESIIDFEDAFTDVAKLAKLPKLPEALQNLKLLDQIHLPI